MIKQHRIAYLDNCDSDTRKVRIDGLRSRGYDVKLAPKMESWDNQLMRKYLKQQLEDLQIDRVVSVGEIASHCMNNADIFGNTELICLYPSYKKLESYLPRVRGKMVMPRAVNDQYDHLIREKLDVNLMTEIMPFVYYDFQVPISNGEFISVVGDTLKF